MTSTPPLPHPPACHSMAPPSPPLHVPRSLSEGEAFSTLAALVLAEHTLDAVAATVADLVIATVPGATHASVVLVHDAKVRTAVFAGPAAAALDERQYEAGFGPCTRAALSGATVHLHHDALTTTGSSFAALAERSGISSVLCLALRMREHPWGAEPLRFRRRRAQRLQRAGDGRGAGLRRPGRGGPGQRHRPRRGPGRG